MIVGEQTNAARVETVEEFFKPDRCAGADDGPYFDR